MATTTHTQQQPAHANGAQLVLAGGIIALATFLFLGLVVNTMALVVGPIVGALVTPYGIRTRRRTVGRERTMATIGTVLGAVTAVWFGAFMVASAVAGDSDRLSKSEFLARGNAICAAGTQKMDQAGAAFFTREPTPTQVAAFAAAVAVPTAQAEIDQLRALKAPTADEATVAALLDKAQQAVDRVRADPTLLGRDNGSDEANALARAYGLTACAN